MRSSEQRSTDSLESIGFLNGVSFSSTFALLPRGSTRSSSDSRDSTVHTSDCPKRTRARSENSSAAIKLKNESILLPSRFPDVSSSQSVEHIGVRSTGRASTVGVSRIIKLPELLAWRHLRGIERKTQGEIARPRLRSRRTFSPTSLHAIGRNDPRGIDPRASRTHEISTATVAPLNSIARGGAGGGQAGGRPPSIQSSN